MSQTPSRLEPRPTDQWDDDTRRVLGGTLERVQALEGDGHQGGSGPLNILRTLAHHGGLLEPFLGFASALALRGVLSRRVSELLALRAAWNCRSPFEWAHHVVYARAAGLVDAEIVAIGSDAATHDWSEEDRLLLQAADELHRDTDFSDATWQALRQRFDDAQLVEIPFVVGNYTMLSMVANSLGVPVESGLEPLPKG